MLQKLSMARLIERIRDREDGVTALEYALIAALIAVVIIVSVRAVGTAASTTFSNVANSMNTTH
jgi:pilus assembly protein Flp/PilA